MRKYDASRFNADRQAGSSRGPSLNPVQPLRLVVRRLQSSNRSVVLFVHRILTAETRHIDIDAIVEAFVLLFPVHDSFVQIAKGEAPRLNELFRRPSCFGDCTRTLIAMSAGTMRRRTPPPNLVRPV